MKAKISIILMSLFIVFGCSNSESIPLAVSKTSIPKTSPQIVATSVSQNGSKSAAQVYKTEMKFDIADSLFVQYNECTGKYYRMTQGIAHINFTTMYNDNRYTNVSHVNLSDFRLLDEETGKEYIGSYSSNETHNGTFEIGWPLESKGTLTILMISPGNEVNLKFQIDYHMTINANGVTTVNFDNLKVSC